jgi:hypothetical protein
VVEAADVVTEALGTFQKFTPSMLACSWTTPAETPLEVVTTRVALGRTVPASRMAGVAVVADCAASDSTGPMPVVNAATETPCEAYTPISSPPDL